MRQIGTVPDAHAARTFADYLTSLKIESRLDHQTQGWALWVFDEDRVQQAKTELEQFLSNPDDPRYTRRPTTQPPPPRIADAEPDADLEETDRPAFFEVAQLRQVVVTVVLALGSIAVYISTGFGQSNNALAQALQIAPDGDTTLAHVLHGELWRLVSPIFLHFSFPHILFNVLVLGDLGRQVEQRRGAIRYLLLILAVAIVSNLAQYFLASYVWGSGFTQPPSGSFGGLSGVLYGVFGYLWIKSRWEPNLGFRLLPGTTAIMVGWLFACLFLPADILGPVANVAHVVGLLMGLVIGYASYVLRAVRQR